MKSPKTLGEIVKHRRQARGLTQRQLAEMLGVKGSHVAYLESGRRKPSFALIKHLADVLELDPQQLFLLAHPEAKSLLGSSADLVPLEDPAKAWQRFASSYPLQCQISYHAARDSGFKAPQLARARSHGTRVFGHQHRCFDADQRAQRSIQS